MRLLCFVAALVAGGGPAAAAWDKTSLPPFVTWSEINPRAVRFDARSAWAACHSERPGQLYFAPAPESVSIPATHRARRAGNLLRVGVARFRDDAGPEVEAGFVQHTYVGRYRKAPVDLVHIQYYEGIDWMLVDRSTGATARFGGVPIQGPDGHTFLAVGDAEDEGLMGVEVGVWSGGKFKMEAKIDALYPCDAAWKGPGLIELMAIPTAAGSPSDLSPSSWKPARIRKAHGRWRFEWMS